MELLSYNRKLNVPGMNETIRCGVLVQQRESKPIAVTVLNDALFLYRGDLRRKQTRQNAGQPVNWKNSTVHEALRVCQSHPDPPDASSGHTTSFLGRWTAV